MSKIQTIWKTDDSWLVWILVKNCNHLPFLLVKYHMMPASRKSTLLLASYLDSLCQNVNHHQADCFWDARLSFLVLNSSFWALRLYPKWYNPEPSISQIPSSRIVNFPNSIYFWHRSSRSRRVYPGTRTKGSWSGEWRSGYQGGWD